MNPITLRELEITARAGGVRDVLIAAQGGEFAVTVTTHDGARVLASTREKQPRTFRDPRKALALLHGLGIDKGRFDASDWTPEASRTSMQRPDRANAMRRAHQAAARLEWLAGEVGAADEDPRPNVGHDQVMADMDTMIASFTKGGKA